MTDTRPGADRRPSRAAIATWAGTGTAWAAIMLIRLFAGGTVGLADNGDSRRLMCQLGVRVARPYYSDPEKYLYPVYVAHRWYGEACGADGSGEPYRSSELWLLSVTKHLTGLLGFRGALDLRVLGGLCAVLVGMGVGLIAVVSPGSLVRKVATASLFGLVMADGSVAEYFVSAYSEPAALLGTLFLCAALLWMGRRGRVTWGPLVAVAVAASWAMAAKTQSVALLPAVIVAILWLPGEGRSGRAIGQRWPALVTAVVLVLAAAVVLGQAPKRFGQIDAYDEVFSEILPHSGNRSADLRWLGVDPALASASGSNVLSANSAATSVAYLHFRDHVDEALILRFYVAHPGRLFPVAGEGLRAVAAWRESYLGTYRPGPNRPPGQIENRLGLTTDMWRDQSPALIVIFWVATAALGWRAARDARSPEDEKAMGRLAVFLALAAFCQFWAVMLSEGHSDIFKHMVLTEQAYALGTAAFVACIGGRIKLFFRSIDETFQHGGTPRPVAPALEGANDPGPAASRDP